MGTSDLNDIADIQHRLGKELARMRVLLVDRHASARNSMRIILSSLGITAVHNAGTSAEVLRQVKAYTFDIILSDYHLDDGRDGQQLLEELRHKNLISLSTVYMVVTAERAYQNVVSVAELAPDDYLIKPFTADQFHSRLIKTIYKKHFFEKVFGHLDNGAYAEALAACDPLLALPDLPFQQRLNVLHSKATFQFQLNRREESLATVEQALAFAPDDRGFRLSRARLLSRLRRFTEALAEIEPLAGMPEMQCAAGCVKARALANLGRFVEADAVLKLLREQYPHEALEREFEPWRLPDETLPDSLHKRYTGRGLYLIDFFNAQSECDWSDREKVLSEIVDLTADVLEYGFVAGMEPHRMLSLPIDPALQRAMARAQATAVAAHIAPIREQLPIQWPSTLHELSLIHI